METLVERLEAGSNENVRYKYRTITGLLWEAAARIRELEGALTEIAKAKPKPVAKDFVQGPAALWGWAQWRAKEALKAPNPPPMLEARET